MKGLKAVADSEKREEHQTTTTVHLPEVKNEVIPRDFNKDYTEAKPIILAIDTFSKFYWLVLVVSENIWAFSGFQG